MNMIDQYQNDWIMKKYDPLIYNFVVNLTYNYDKQQTYLNYH